ncbi:hypothetical protein H5J22_00130 [Cetobacterium sp. 8H]|uniref:hypothetical protein n=1 Tax=Cetobacterium sp. 8H TaxID=2759681 RepID=UPI00163C368D|nr:hypothetical protein [Cetobacterium sp. 8H]MBC2849850.1 hypothetical protein [Cetobacterium sp. 8H]MBC2849867.1 hypothetical protein [Cetobacterium sp. 8H]
MLQKYQFARARGKSGNYKKMSFTLFNDNVKKVKDLADKKQVSRSSIVNRALDEYFKEYPGSDTNEEE